MPFSSNWPHFCLSRHLLRRDLWSGTESEGEFRGDRWRENVNKERNFRRGRIFCEERKSGEDEFLRERTKIWTGLTPITFFGLFWPLSDQNSRHSRRISWHFRQTSCKRSQQKGQNIGSVFTYQSHKSVNQVLCFCF